ncbi:MAG TPA: hypothetical protein VFS20_25295 [Longimicrobium sp.]|nr:hypothetical protein [Longimicrobium sp.]
MARYGMDYDRGYRGARGYGSDYREGGDWNRDEFTSGSRHYNTVHNDWHINRDAGTGDRGWVGGNRQMGGYGYHGGTGSMRPNRDLDQGGYGEAGWTGWSGARSSRDLGGDDRWERYGTTSRGFGGSGNRGYDVEDYSTFRAGGGYTGGGYTGGGYTGGGYSGGGYMGGGYTGGMNRGSMGGYGASNWSRDRGEFNDRGYDQDFGDRVREGWDNLRDHARGFFRR